MSLINLPVLQQTVNISSNFALPAVKLAERCLHKQKMPFQWNGWPLDTWLSWSQGRLRHEQKCYLNFLPFLCHWLSQCVLSDRSHPFSVFFSHGLSFEDPTLREHWCTVRVRVGVSSVQLYLEEVRKHDHSSYQSIEHVKIKQTGLTWGLRALWEVWEHWDCKGEELVSKSRILDSNLSSAIPLHLLPHFSRKWGSLKQSLRF